MLRDQLSRTCQVRATAVRQPAMDGTIGPPRVVLVTDEHGVVPRAAAAETGPTERLILKARRLTPQRVAVGPSPAAAAAAEDSGSGAVGPGREGAGASERDEAARKSGGEASAPPAQEQEQRVSSVRLPETLTHWKARAARACHRGA